MTLRRWLDPDGVRAAILLTLVAVLANGVWILLDDGTPSWDQSNYLWSALQYKAAFAGFHPIGLVDSILATDPNHGPLFSVLLLPLLYVFGPTPDVGPILNLLISPILFLSVGQIAYRVFRSGLARLLAIVLVATMPLMVGLLHESLQDFLLVTLCALSLLLLLESDGFRRRGITLGLGVAMGLGTLTKVTFPAFVAGPLLIVLAQVVYEHVRARRGKAGDDAREGDVGWIGLNLAGALILYLLVAILWYGPNFSETRDYVKSTTGGTLSEGAGPSDPLTFDAIANFTTGVLNAHVSMVLVLVGIVAAAFCLPRIRSLFDSPIDTRRLFGLAFVVAWAVIPYLSVATAKNQDVRLMAAAMPAVAILVAGAVSAVRLPAARTALVVVAVAIPSFQVLAHTVSLNPPLIPDQPSVTIGDYRYATVLTGEPLGYEELPGKDYATPVFEHLEEEAARLPGGSEAPRSICMLQSEPLVNGNTYKFFAGARGDNFQFYELVTAGGGEAELEELLAGCEMALYIEQPKTTDESRLALVNAQYAANLITARQLRQFKGPRESFPVGGVPEVPTIPGDPRDEVTVLVREPAGPGVAKP